MTEGGAMTEPERNDLLLRHCEARSAVAIHGNVRLPSWIASFLAMTERGRNDRGGRNDRAKSQPKAPFTPA
jgi:hypothetical protein